MQSFVFQIQVGTPNWTGQIQATEFLTPLEFVFNIDITDLEQVMVNSAVSKGGISNSLPMTTILPKKWPPTRYAFISHIVIVLLWTEDSKSKAVNPN